MHYAESKDYAEQAEDALNDVTDPGHKALTLAFLALTHAVLNASEDLSELKTQLADVGSAIRYPAS